MSFAEMLQYILISLPAALVGMVTTAAALVFWQSYRRMRATDSAYLDIGGFIALMVGVVFDVIVLAGMGVGKFYDLMINGWAGIVGMIVGVLLPVFGFKAVGKFTSNNATSDTQSGPPNAGSGG